MKDEDENKQKERPVKTSRVKNSFHKRAQASHSKRRSETYNQDTLRNRILTMLSKGIKYKVRPVHSFLSYLHLDHWCDDMDEGVKERNGTVDNLDVL